MKAEQLTFAANGYIAPCPYREQCHTYKIGCKGGCYWCGMFDEKKRKKKKEKEKKD